jgi:hypothetical protein
LGFQPQKQYGGHLSQVPADASTTNNNHAAPDSVEPESTPGPGQVNLIEMVEDFDASLSGIRFKAASLISDDSDAFAADYYRAPKGWRWIWKSPAITYTCSTLFVLLLLGQFCVPWLDHYFGGPLGDNTDIVRIIMLCASFIMLASAAPTMRPTGWKPEDDAANYAMHEDFQRKIRR